jgi:hypothetical protein
MGARGTPGCCRKGVGVRGSTVVRAGAWSAGNSALWEAEQGGVCFCHQHAGERWGSGW